MLIAQVTIGGAIAVAIFAGIVFALFGLRRDGSTPAMQQVSATILEAFEAYLGRVYLTAFAAAILLAVAAGGAVGAYERSLENGALAGGAVMVGALVAAIAGIAGALILVRGHRSAAAAAQRGPRTAARRAMTLAGAASLLSAAFMLAGAVGLFATYTAILGKPLEDAPQLLVAFAAGAALVASIVRASGGVLGAGSASAMTALSSGMVPVPANDPRNPGVAAAMVARTAASGGTLSDVADSSGLLSIAALVIGAAIYHVTGEIEWALLPATLAAAGIVASLAGLLAGRVGADGRASPLGVVASTVVSGGAIAGICFGMIEDDWWWFAGAAGLGYAGALASFLVHRSANRASQRASGGEPAVARASNERISARAAAATLIVGAAVVLGAQVLGEQGATRPIGDAMAGLYGIVLAAVGFLMPGAYLAAPAAARPVAEGASAMADIAFDAPPETRPSASSALAILSDSSAGSHGYGALAALLSIMVAVLALLQVVRVELGAVAADDGGRYADLAQDIGVAPPGSDVNAAVAVAIDQYRQLLEDARVATGDDDVFGDGAIERLIAADRAETGGHLGRLLDDGDVSFNDVRDIEASPYPLPRVLPLNLGRAEVIAGALAGAAAAVLLLGRLSAGVVRTSNHVGDEVRRQFIDTPGVRTGEVRADYARAGDAGTRAAMRAALLPLGGLILLPALFGIGLAYAFGRDGNEGWLSMAAVGPGLGLVAAVFALWLPGHREAGTAEHVERETVTEATAFGVTATRVTVADIHSEPPSSGYEAAAALVLPALARLVVAVALVLAPLSVG